MNAGVGQSLACLHHVSHQSTQKETTRTLKTPGVAAIEAAPALFVAAGASSPPGFNWMRKFIIKNLGFFWLYSFVLHWLNLIRDKLCKKYYSHRHSRCKSHLSISLTYDSHGAMGHQFEHIRSHQRGECQLTHPLCPRGCSRATAPLSSPGVGISLVSCFSF